MLSLFKSVDGLKKKMLDEITKFEGSTQSGFNTQIQLDDALFGLTYTEKALSRLLEIVETDRQSRLAGNPDAKTKNH
jgi:hypothetical protein